MSLPAEQLDLDESETRPIVELLRIAGPTVAQMASFTVMQFLDTWMLHHVGDGIIAPTAGANSGILAFSVISLGMGVLWVVNTLVSQAFGRKDYVACGQFMWQGIWFSLLLSAVVLPLLPFAPRFFLALGHEPKLAAAEAVYLQIVVAWSIFKMTQTAVAQFLLAIDRAIYVMTATILAVSVNALVAWILIFGKLGVPPMGIVGAAWAQNIGVLVEMLLCVTFALHPAVRARFNVFDWKPRIAQMRTLLKVGIPSGAQVFVEVLSWAAWGNVVMAIFGTKAMAGTSFVFRYMAVSFMPAFGIGTAVTALVGRYIGRGRPDLAMKRAHLGFGVAVIYMLACAVGFVLFRRQLIGVFADDADVIALGSTMLIFAAFYQLFDCMYVVYYGALRGAGDTLAPAIFTAVLSWTVTVLGGYLIAHNIPRLGPSGPWCSALLYGVILGIYISTRFVRGGWRSINLDGHATVDKVPGFDVIPTTVTAES